MLYEPGRIYLSIYYNRIFINSYVCLRYIKSGNTHPFLRGHSSINIIIQPPIYLTRYLSYLLLQLSIAFIIVAPLLAGIINLIFIDIHHRFYCISILFSSYRLPNTISSGISSSEVQISLYFWIRLEISTMLSAICNFN